MIIRDPLPQDFYIDEKDKELGRARLSQGAKARALGGGSNRHVYLVLTFQILLVVARIRLCKLNWKERLWPLNLAISSLKARYYSFKGLPGILLPKPSQTENHVFRGARVHIATAKQATEMIFGVEALPSTRKMQKNNQNLCYIIFS